MTRCGKNGKAETADANKEIIFKSENQYVILFLHPMLQY